MSGRDFFTLQRRIFAPDSWLWDMPAKQTKVAVTLIGMANWKQGKTFSGGNVVIVDRGQIMTSLDAIAAASRVSRATVRVALSNLAKAEFLTCKSTNRYRIITILNYSREQSKELADEHAQQQASDRPTAGQQQANSRPVTPIEQGNKGTKKQGNKRGSQIPDSWEPTEKHVAKADETNIDLADSVARFRDHHIAKGSVMKSWDAAFNTWLRNAKKFQDRDRANQSSAGKQQVFSTEDLWRMSEEIPDEKE